MIENFFAEDNDPQETAEWLDAMKSLIKQEGIDRASFILQKLVDAARLDGVPYTRVTTPYVNTIQTRDEIRMPGDVHMERRIRSLVRWNALIMVMRANEKEPDLGGHISTFASSATLYDVGFNYFFKGANAGSTGDLLYIQGHSAPGIYARAYLEGRLSQQQLEKFRREVDGEGLSSYPHPWLMPTFWQFPTVSMGLGPLQAIYQAHIMKYLINRQLIKDDERKVWAFLGDGEMDEPESLGAISLAGREKLDNLIFVVNCNLQRLDGPVRGNGKIIQELEGVFRGAGWNVIKVIWGRMWDPLLEHDTDDLLKRRMMEAVDGQYQTYKNRGGAYTREHFFGKYPELKARVSDLTDEQIEDLNRGGHDPYKVYAAYAKAVKPNGKPTVVLAKTIKGYGLGPGESSNKTHSMKKMDIQTLKDFRDRYGMPFTDQALEHLPYYHPGEESAEIRYMKARREALGGYLPARDANSAKLDIPDLSLFQSQLAGSEGREISTTMTFVRILSTLTKDKNIGEKIVPIVPDEARTFGMEGMFRQLGIYSTAGQLYEPEDAGQMMYYKEDIQGRILEEGINEAGAFSAWMATATAYANHRCPMIPFYIFYSMFGFQRIGDFAWAAGDLRARGFLLGATSGRTTLNGEGLQHQDGHSHVLASTIPNCVSYDPTYAYELAVIIHDGLKRMYAKQENVFYYITLMNENYVQPAMPEGVEQGIIDGLYLLQPSTPETSLQVQLLGSGAILREVIAAADLLKNDFNVGSEVWSVTSFNELRKQGLAAQRWNLLHPEVAPRSVKVSECLNGSAVPVVAATDYIRAYADQIRPFINKTYVVLGTDGFGRSDSRAKLRAFFEVDRYFIVLAALSGLLQQGKVDASLLTQAIKKYAIDPDKADPFTC
jgi:pyruvate dehydrogenase E1 component